jgi:hypothetical protein
MVATHKQQFNKRHGFAKEEPHSLAELAKISKLKLNSLKEVYNRGVGAFKTNPTSVRPNVKSPEQWAMARVYAFINKIEKGAKLNHDTDLIPK